MTRTPAASQPGMKGEARNAPKSPTPAAQAGSRLMDEADRWEDAGMRPAAPPVSGGPETGGVLEEVADDLRVISLGLAGSRKTSSVSASLMALALRLEALSAPSVDQSGEAVGEVGEMPGSNGGFTMAVFKATDVPLGTTLYAAPPPAAPEGGDQGSFSQAKIPSQTEAGRSDNLQPGGGG